MVAAITPKEGRTGRLVFVTVRHTVSGAAGVAAVLKSYFPKLTYADIKRIIVQSATPYKTKVRRPESTDTVDFASLSKTGGVVNLYEAVKLALGLGVKTLIPCHYDMFTFNTADPADFVREAQTIEQPHTVLRPGEYWAIPCFS